MPATITDRLQGLTTSVAVKPPCKAVTTTAITQSGAQTIGGVACVDGDRYLYAITAGSVLNGIWIVRDSAHERAKDFDGSRDVVKGTLVLTEPGTSQAQMWEVTTANPIVIGTSVITLVQHTPEELTLRGDLASTASPNIVGFNPTLNYAAGTIGKSQRDRVWSITDFPWGAVGDDATDNYAAILAAQTALAAAGGGTLLIPRGTFRILTAIPRVANVDFAGLGWASILKPVSCSAFTYAFTTGFGNSVTRDLAIQGSSGTTQIGIYQPGTLDDADELYGITIDNVAIRGFNTAIQFRTVRNVTIRNCWLQDVNSGIHLIGKCLVVNICDCKIVYAAGCGTGTQFGVYTDFFNYTSGTGLVRPESVKISNNHIFGFQYGVSFEGVVYGFVSGCDVQATIEGVLYSSVQTLTVERSYIQVAGAAGSTGLRGKPQASVLDTKVVIKHNNFNAVSTTAATSIGCLLGTLSVSGNQDGVTIEDNEFHGFTLYDVAMYASGDNAVRRNRCSSTAVTSSMLISSIPANRMVWVDWNYCYSTIGTDAADVNAGRAQVGSNVINQTAIDHGNLGSWFTPAFAAGDFTGNGAMTWTVAAGDVAVMQYTIRGKLMTVNLILSTTTVGGVLNSLLQIKIPAGRSAAARAINPCHILDNGTRAIAYLEINPSTDATLILVNKADASNWAAAADTTHVRGQITFEIV